MSECDDVSWVSLCAEKYLFFKHEMKLVWWPFECNDIKPYYTTSSDSEIWPELKGFSVDVLDWEEIKKLIFG
jgi:hypothetical protein